MAEVVMNQSLDIDIYELHKEWERQPRLFHNAAMKSADAKSKLDTAKSRLDVVEAELAMAIRRDPEKFGLVKATDNSVKECIPTRQEYRDAVAEVNTAKYEVAVLEAKVSALDHKKRALESLVSLFLSDYWAEPRAPKGCGEAVRESEKTATRSRGQKRRGE